MFAWAYKRNPQAKFTINDINTEIIMLHKTIRDEYKDFIRHLDMLEGIYLRLKNSTPNHRLEKEFNVRKEPKNWFELFKADPSRRSFFYHARTVYHDNVFAESDAVNSALLYILMKTCFNGLWSTKESRFFPSCGDLDEVDFVYNRRDILNWHKALQRTDIMCGDFKDALKNVQPNSFVFLDPPYRGCAVDYNTETDDSFQIEVINEFKRVESIGAQSILSNRDIGDGFFEGHFSASCIEKIPYIYTSGAKDSISATELLIKTSNIQPIQASLF